MSGFDDFKGLGVTQSEGEKASDVFDRLELHKDGIISFLKEAGVSSEGNDGDGDTSKKVDRLIVGELKQAIETSDPESLKKAMGQIGYLINLSEEEGYEENPYVQESEIQVPEEGYMLTEAGERFNEIKQSNLDAKPIKEVAAEINEKYKISDLQKLLTILESVYERLQKASGEEDGDSSESSQELIRKKTPGELREERMEGLRNRQIKEIIGDLEKLSLKDEEKDELADLLIKGDTNPRSLGSANLKIDKIISSMEQADENQNLIVELKLIASKIQKQF